MPRCLEKARFYLHQGLPQPTEITETVSEYATLTKHSSFRVSSIGTIINIHKPVVDVIKKHHGYRVEVFVVVADAALHGRSLYSYIFAIDAASAVIEVPSCAPFPHSFVLFKMSLLLHDSGHIGPGIPLTQ
jgi:hypothetical protein